MHPVSARAGRRRGKRRHPRPAPGEVVRETDVERTSPGDIITGIVVTLDYAFARRHLLVMPRGAGGCGLRDPGGSQDTAHGQGDMFPAFPEGTEEQMALDRPVLVVRKQ